MTLLYKPEEICQTKQFPFNILVSLCLHYTSFGQFQSPSSFQLVKNRIEIILITAFFFRYIFENYASHVYICYSTG